MSIHEALGGWNSINIVRCPLLNNATLHQHPATNVYTTVKNFQKHCSPSTLRVSIRRMSNPESSSAAVEWRHGTKKKSHVQGNAEVKGHQQAVNS